MEQYPDFTLCAFPEAYRGKLQFVGSRSGRDGDKIRDSGLTPIASQVVAAPSFDEAELVLECRKLYWQDLDPLHFLDPQVESLYPQKDYHRMYCGEIAQALAAS
jgi:flavin reductase (DIM6/NTAB) family NADH-FMN oxidoreductase RutF